MNRITLIPLSLLLSASLFLTSACTEQARTPAEEADATEMIQHDNKQGTGEEAIPGHLVSIHYTGWLYDKTSSDHHGKKFDSSRDRGQPVEFLLGAGHVIKAWDQGLEDMKVGGQRTLIVPARLGYGAEGKADLAPPNSMLVYDIELVGVRENPSAAGK